MLDDLPVSQVAAEVDACLELQAPLAHAAEARLAMKVHPGRMTRPFWTSFRGGCRNVDNFQRP